ncbi:FMN-binding negative transcriptional regulator [Nitrogeniibacter mangrovi]|uniref:FMN-binding negative transcriptional regulator n=1 Tax=Nitrogeniibacter mangrovi TaxID=2016596 RepID=A0A6C1B154_9RHOO|nr:FMN-binding negative transcriptional regulator [Nitrogeniibacter mangrovi]QID16558.1 FMN-binding negative transcriptional regulator [Nitrogeniibacter mangrovi]
MYCPRHFSIEDPACLHEFMRAHPLATLVTHGADGLDANHVPLMVRGAEGAERLAGHVARANPLWEDHDGEHVLCVFQGPDHYISPSAYPTKAETGKVVPTWNYAVVHARGILRVIEERDWLHALVTDLTRTHEAGLPTPWQVSDAPDDYVERMLGAIVGIEIEVTRLVGKWKVSQNQPENNRAGVVQALSTGDEAARAMAGLVERFAKDRP